MNDHDKEIQARLMKMVDPKIVGSCLVQRGSGRWKWHWACTVGEDLIHSGTAWTQKGAYHAASYAPRLYREEVAGAMMRERHARENALAAHNRRQGRMLASQLKQPPRGPAPGGARRRENWLDDPLWQDHEQETW